MRRTCDRQRSGNRRARGTCYRQFYGTIPGAERVTIAQPWCRPELSLGSRRGTSQP
jgi:hypothetical protein